MIRILEGDCRAVMATLPEASVDAIVTDPPYLLDFMGKEWDTAAAMPTLDAGLGHWLAGFTDGEGCFTTRKSGAGFVCEFVIHLRADDAAILRAVHAATGIGDMRGPTERADGGSPMVKWVVSRQADCAKLIAIFEAFPLRAKKARDFVIWREAVHEWRRHEPGAGWEGIADLAEMLSAVKRYGAGFNRDQFFHYRWARAAFRMLKPGGHLLAFGGSRTYHRLAAGIEDAGFEVRDQIQWVYASGFPKSHNGPWGGTALKPAHEPIVLARKPLIGTVEANWREHGTGALNIDGCRVHSDDSQGYAYTVQRMAPGADQNKTGKTKQESVEFQGHTKDGRWPANLIHDGSDEVLAAFPQAPGQQATASTSTSTRSSQNVYGDMARGSGGAAPRLDAGSAARFFYCAKADRADRNEGLADPGPQFQHGSTLRDAENLGAARKGNHHPTVKPTDLMRYLCRLVTPPGGLVLDPFMGSGSTLKAAELEGFSAIGIELDADYIAIARRRIAADAPLFAEVTP